MRPVSEERGMVAVFIAFALVALMGFGAVVIDVGALYQERRELQNGADAGALALASDCAGAGCGDFMGTADEFADANANDLDSDVAEVCGTALDLVCADPPDVPAVVKYVRVTTTTRDAASGGTQVLFGLARIFGKTGRTVRARSTAAYGPPALSGMAAPPLVFSMCEYNAAVGGPEGAELLPYWPDEDPTTGPERYVYFHGDTENAGSCGAGPSGADLPGGFGWLENDGTCTSETHQHVTEESEETWVHVDPGNDVPRECDTDSWHTEDDEPIVMTFPFFDEAVGTGTGAEYHVAGLASIYVTGFNFPGGNRWPSDFLCPEADGSAGNASLRCIRGHFVRAAVDGDEFGTVDLGTRIIKVIE